MSYVTFKNFNGKINKPLTDEDMRNVKKWGIVGNLEIKYEIRKKWFIYFICLCRCWKEATIRKDRIRDWQRNCWKCYI